MSGEKFTITEVHLAWTDNGKKMFNVWFTRANGSRWLLREWAKDELDAYMVAVKRLEEGAD
jgi:hypothetical protein